MSKIIVSGGKQRTRTLGVKEWSQYEGGTVLVIDTDTQQVLHKHEYLSPEEYTPDTPDVSVLFKAATVVGNTLYACTQTEVIVYSLPEFKQLNHISSPCFNDVHHVTPTERNTLLVVSTGLDLIIEMDMQGNTVNEWFTVETSDWKRFDRSLDYRKIVTTKPHHSHPNFVFQYKDNIWVTRFEQKDAVCLTAEGRIVIGTESPHDGHIRSNHAYFTTVDGHIIEASMDTQEVTRRFPLRNIYGDENPMGWCRALCVQNENSFIVGFSRIRASKIHRNLLWAKKYFEDGNKTESLPTRIASIDINNESINWEFDLEPHDLNAIFSINLW